MYSFPERKLLDDVVTAVFKLKARGKLNEMETGQLLTLTRMAEIGENPKLFAGLRQALVKPGLCGEDSEVKALIIETLLSSDLHNTDDVNLLESMIIELIQAAS